ncbi:hypothetical protein F0U44_09900 [Nocardioides humilatus]|uniref:CARDB domain-containing protein n=1 Tax=Nocardioides humilatus TaxID=2607660 RepID=A0A5B1LEQ5_9ACTN|nr:hypothetical protein [Nocardioides humilatus]KAA1418794.1 hypothetical protein F0U44_09900 [Nocardioides humilatus]
MSMLPRALAFLLSCCLVGLPAAPASAADDSARILIKGKGSRFTASSNPSVPAAIATAIPRSKPVKYTARVLNTGDDPARFKVDLFTDPLFIPATQTVKVGKVDITAEFEDSGVYTTPILAPGDYVELDLRVTPDPDFVPDNPNYSLVLTGLLVYSTDSEYLTGGALYTMLKAPAHGTSGAEIYVRQGSQPYVGGEILGGFAMSPVVSAGGSASFKAKFQNDTAETQQIIGDIDVLAVDCTELTAKRGSADVTEVLMEGDYVTEELAPGKSETIKIVLRWNGEDCGYPYVAAQIHAYGPEDPDGIDEQEYHYALIALPLEAE